MEKEQIMEDAIRELTELALQERREAADEAEQEMLKTVVELSTRVMHVLDQLPKEEREILKDYLEKKETIADHDCRHLYIQGAKDCIKLLKTLELI